MDDRTNLEFHKDLVAKLTEKRARLADITAEGLSAHLYEVYYDVFETKSVQSFLDNEFILNETSIDLYQRTVQALEAKISGEDYKIFDKLKKDKMYRKYITNDNPKVKNAFLAYHPAIKTAIEHICAVYSDEELEYIKIAEDNDGNEYLSGCENMEAFNEYMQRITRFVSYSIKSEDYEKNIDKFSEIAVKFSDTPAGNYFNIGSE